MSAPAVDGPSICPPEHAHELTCATHHGCPCDDCRTYRTQQRYWHRHMVAAGRYDLITVLVDARGARRRLEALMTLGWSGGRVAERMGLTASQLHLWLHAERITFDTHERIAAVYDELCTEEPAADTHGQKVSVNRARNTARARGYARPIDWDDIDNDPEPQTGVEVLVDEIAIELAVHGHRVELTRAERHIALKALHARGYNDQELAHLLRVSDKTIGRDREELDLPANLGTREERLAAA